MMRVRKWDVVQLVERSRATANSSRKAIAAARGRRIAATMTNAVTVHRERATGPSRKKVVTIPSAAARVPVPGAALKGQERERTLK